MCDAGGVLGVLYNSNDVWKITSVLIVSYYLVYVHLQGLMANLKAHTCFFSFFLFLFFFREIGNCGGAREPRRPANGCLP